MPGLLTRSALGRPLAALLQGLGLTRPAQSAACGLGLDGLPHGLGQLPVGTPLALAWQDHAPDLVWSQALLQDLLRQGPVFLLAEDEARADALLQAAELEQARSQGRLTVWLMGSGPGRVTSPPPMSAVFDELAQAGLSPAHALLVLGSAQAQLGRSVAGLQQWGRQIGNWCRGRVRPVVFAFDAWDSADMVLAPLRTLAGVFEHVAVLGSRPQGSMLFVERWNGSEGALFELRLGLKQDAHSQRLAYDGSQLRGAAQRLVEAPDQYQVIATQAAVAAQRGVPAAWRVVGQLGDVLGATRDAVAATVLLDAGGTQQHEALLELVFQLRSQHGRALKIVVCETQDKLRSNLEQALLTLGANRVVYREVGFARLLRLIDDMREETFVRAIPTDYAQARSGFLPDALRGYLPLPAFCDSVQAMLARSGQRGLRHSFLRLTMLPHVAHLDAIQACMALRDGDVLSADQNALYVFLFACAETDTDPALARLFSIAPSELFAAQTLYGSSDGVNSVLRDLREAARKGVPDYSAYRSSSSVSAPRGSSKPEPQPVARLRLPLQENADHATQTPSVHARPLARRTSTSTGPIAQGANHARTNPAGADHAD